MTSILTRDPNGPPCPVCGEGGEMQRKVDLLRGIGASGSSESERNLRALAGREWYERARELVGRRTVCNGCASSLRFLCREYDAARAYAEAAKRLNPESEEIEKLARHFEPGSERPRDWLGTVRIMTFPDKNSIEPATTLLQSNR